MPLKPGQVNLLLRIWTVLFSLDITSNTVINIFVCQYVHMSISIWFICLLYFETMSNLAPVLVSQLPCARITSVYHHSFVVYILDSFLSINSKDNRS